MELKQVEISFSRIESYFVNEHIVNNYALLLQDCPSIGAECIHQITKMYHRIFVKNRAEPLFYRVIRQSIDRKGVFMWKHEANIHALI